MLQRLVNMCLFIISYARVISAIAGFVFLCGCSAKAEEPVLNPQKLAKEYFKEDADWYIDNIPFFECSDKQMEAVYYYRWKMYKAHIRNTGSNQFVITEFINDMGWDRDPYSTINAASMHHIYEGRWLRDDRYINGYINYLYQQGGNDRRYSESIADAAYARFLVNADSAFLIRQLDSMKYIYDKWYDHFDSAKNMYYIPAMPDATEYTIASIDASGGTAGFDGGDAFRPTINSYMYGNALAIAKIAKWANDSVTENIYLRRAFDLKKLVQQNLWNDSMQHFIDRFKQNNQYVHYWDFIRSRELAGMAPWYFNLPANNKKYSEAWKHVLDTNNLLGQYGLRTNEPSYEYYFKQFVYFQGQRGSQWNGPSWPFQTSITLTGMANLLNNYGQSIVTPSDYIKLLRLYTQQHYLPDGSINLVENYDPDLGGPIVYYYWSNHYNHSTYNNLIITGLCGIQPSEDDTLIVNPLVDESIRYFLLDNISYHGHTLKIVYDEDGSKYNAGKGLMIFVDGKNEKLVSKKGKNAVVVGNPIVKKISERPENYALNIRKKFYPIPSASINTVADTLYQAIDGKIWYFPEITNRWTTTGSADSSDWYSLDFGEPKKISGIKLYLLADDKTYLLPDSISIEFYENGHWKQADIRKQVPEKFKRNTVNTFDIDAIKTAKLKVQFAHGKNQVAI